ncbi:Trehalase [Astathelohania contejeani]|uniref:Trehalase n=1 Tax=Astathelohania contejeani TaxID=164912 RepID=A0ABQ7I123_9MICR|nr:Trehalase [Thelohania contejeani]
MIHLLIFLMSVKLSKKIGLQQYDDMVARPKNDEMSTQTEMNLKAAKIEADIMDRENMSSNKSNDKMQDCLDNLNTYTDINLLFAVQMLLPQKDSKDFVDRPTKRPFNEVLKEFKGIEQLLGLDKVTIYEKVPRNSKDDSIIFNKQNITLQIATMLKIKNKDRDKVKVFEKFLETNFGPVGGDITKHEPVDYNEHPRFIDNLSNAAVIKLSKELNKIWKELSVKKVEQKNGGSSTLLTLPYPFIIPGGRFREFYYWDTYWILEGLLVSDMATSAENIVKNFIAIIDEYGYIPNGTRKYYLYRSQAPYFPMMLLKLLDYEKKGEFNDLVLGKGLEMAEKEYRFFDKYRKVEVLDKNGDPHFLNYYHVHTDFPRPESFGEDLLTYHNQNVQTAHEVFSNLKSGAESGWDFSSRWFLKENDIKTISAYHQIPVELNAVLYRNEKILELLFKRKKNTEKAAYYREKAHARKIAINRILWNSEHGSWMDFNLITREHVSRRFYFSNLTPMIYGIRPEGNTSIYSILSKYSKEIFGYPGGIPASGEGVDTGQQWDFPNVWAPHQHMLAEFLVSIGENEMALHIARAFFNSALAGFESGNAFFEKYNCLVLGQTGAGGEYKPQTGFGWTNGTLLSFILQFGDKLAEGPSHKESYERILHHLALKTVSSEPIMNPTKSTNDLDESLGFGKLGNLLF